MTGTSTLYDILDVAPDAAQGVIEAAYRALIKKYHPDRIAAGAGGDEKRAAEINQAYTVLRDPARRALYDSEMRKRSEAADIFFQIARTAREAKGKDGKPLAQSAAAREAAQKLERLDPARHAQLPKDATAANLPF